jgi:DNA-binding winged helix-turn-helix (wHTH) protein
MHCHYCKECGAPVDKPRAEPEFNGVVLDRQTNCLIYNGEYVKLRKMQADVMGMLMKRERVANQTLFSVLMPDAENDSNVRVHVFYIRKALRNGNLPIKIETLQGWGYRLLPK